MAGKITLDYDDGYVFRLYDGAGNLVDRYDCDSFDVTPEAAEHLMDRELKSWTKRLLLKFQKANLVREGGGVGAVQG